MNKKLILSMAYCCCIFSASFVQAQLLNIDAPETVSDSSNLIGKATDHVKEAQKYIENSQFGKAIGDGIKYAKKGIAFINGDYIRENERLNSPEYKIAKESAIIALLEAQERALKKQQKQIQQETDDKINLVQAEADAKIKNLNKNLANTQILMADGDNEQAKVMAQEINNEIAQVKQNATDKISALQNELQQKTGISPQQKNTAVMDDDESSGQGGQNAAAATEWEISGQNQDSLVASLKPGVRIADTLPSDEAAQILQDLPQAATKTINDKKAAEAQSVLSIKEINTAEVSAVNQKRQRVNGKQPSLLKQVQPAKRMFETQKTTTAVKRIRE